VHSCTHCLRPLKPPPPTFGLIYEGAIGQPRLTTSLCDLLSNTYSPYDRAVSQLIRGIFLKTYFASRQFSFMIKTWESWKYWLAAAGSIPERVKICVGMTPGLTELTLTPLAATWVSFTRFDTFTLNIEAG
jgi:hypothetical protein